MMMLASPKAKVHCFEEGKTDTFEEKRSEDI